MEFLSRNNLISTAREIKINPRRQLFFYFCANCTQTVQSEASYCWVHHSDSKAVLFHTLFNRTVENFYTALTLLSPRQPSWLSNCFRKKSSLSAPTKLLRPNPPNFPVVNVSQLALSFIPSCYDGFSASRCSQVNETTHSQRR
jgi:hypothetical protein